MTTENDTHPLIQKEFRGIRDWKTWKTLWDQAEYDEQLLTLLHVAFDVQAYGAEWAERIRFLLRVANGHSGATQAWHDPRPTANRLEWDERARRVEARRPIAEKAFQVLCDRYFKRRSDDTARDGVSPLSDMTPDLHETLLWFFNDHDRHAYSRNLPHQDDKRHYAKAARDYLRAFVRGAWPLGRSRGERTAETEAALPALRVRYVALLHDLGELHFLYEDDRLEEVAAEALRRFALHDREGQQVYRDAEEAAENYAGRCLLILEARLNNAARKRRTVEAERKQREAERELAEARK